MGKMKKQKTLLLMKMVCNKDKFRLAEAIILEDYEKAFKIMRKLGNNSGEVCVEIIGNGHYLKKLERGEVLRTI